MTGMLANVIVIALLVLIVGSAVLYIRKEKKRGVHCMDVHLQDPVPAHVCPIRKAYQKNDHTVKA